MAARHAVARGLRGTWWLLLAAGSCRATLGIDEPSPRPNCIGSACSTGGLAGAAGRAGGPAARGGTLGGGGEAGQAGKPTGGRPGAGGGANEGGAGEGSGGVSGVGGSGGTGAIAGTESDSGGANVAGAGQGGIEAGAGGSGPTCSEGTLRCNAYQPERCSQGIWHEEGNECAGWCQAGICREAKSCAPGTSTVPCVNGTSCCDTIWVPGGTYQMGQGDEEDPDLSYERTVRGFYLDRFEVTVGRFTAFVAKYALPGEGEGANPHIPMSGWHESWESAPDYDHPGETAVPPSSAELLVQLGDAEHCLSGSTWNTTDTLLPINCVNWYVAFAFCAFDGGRLPTEAEWNFAAAFGSAQRPYPWSQSISDLTITPNHATYFEYPGPLFELPTQVGNHPTGQGGFYRNTQQGHEDLGGNLNEWAADQWLDAPPASCGPDCMAPWSDSDDQRVTRGGAFPTGPYFVRTGHREPSPAYNVSSLYGLRCARDADLSP